MKSGRIQLGLMGAQGRMGRSVQELLLSEFSDKTELLASAGRDADLSTLLQVEAVIDFATPKAMVAMAEKALSSNAELPAFAVGSTGWKADEVEILDRLATKTVVLVASNFSTGVLAMLEILKVAAPMLERMGYAPALVEAHHKHKKDAPSGTALTIQRHINAKHPEQVQTHSIRAGEVIGDHVVTFYGPSDRIELGHFAQNRSLFARGAIDAAIWLAERRRKGARAGYVSMEQFFRERYL